MKPTKEQIEEAIVWITSTYDNSPPNTIVNAYRSALEDIAALKLLRAQDYENLVRTNARAELAERHERESVTWVEAVGMIPEQWADLQARHERERKELEA
jgi:hypothetical protein